ncbi:hypothetical protein FRC14_000980 [Serendipita sp. 396]|nr:hypothetical protein FRC14_000980 [Serendipita sp. 396]KAG8789000.1 hypothetical protein FRC15_000547 [Serendipita sp. 397]KAG8876672.1 hypothetical protein FRC20_001010 [Serendipita sp. 405]
MFHLDEDDEIVPPAQNSTSQYSELQTDPWWATQDPGQMGTVEDPSSLSTSSDFQPISGSPFGFPYATDPLLSDSLGLFPFTTSTRNEGEVSGELTVTDAQDTISPRLLSNVPHEYVSTRASREGVEPGLTQRSAFPLYVSQGARMSPLVDDTAGSCASLLGPLDLTKKRRRRHTVGQHHSLDWMIPNQLISTGSSSAAGTTTGRYADIEHAFSPRFTPSSPLHVLRAVSTTPDDSTGSPYSASSAIDEREVLSPTDPAQLHSWTSAPSQLDLDPDLRQHYDAFIKLLATDLSVEECQKALAPFSIIITQGVEEVSGPLSPSGQTDEGELSEVGGYDIDAAVPTDPIGEGGDVGGVESRKEIGARHLSKKRPRYVGRQCRLCHHMLVHQSQMHQHIMDHFRIYPFRCQKEGCSFSSTRKADLAKHIADQHEMKGVTICPHCHERIKHRRNLPRHIRLKHRGPDTKIIASTSA